MNVKLIAKTVSCIEGINSLEDIIVYCARVSNPQNQLNTSTSDKLLAYCIKNKHWSIFEQASFTVEIKTSRAIAQQILRHKSFSFQELSQRYSMVTGFEDIELRTQAPINRQSSVEIIDNKQLKQKVADHILNSDKLYIELLSEGVARECARFILPLCSETTLYIAGNIRSWVHYLEVRDTEHTQKEHRLIAQKIKDIFKELCPNISKALNY